jgi:hypothetical protein
MKPSETAIPASSYTHTDGKLFKLSTLKAKSKVKKALVQDMLFADDCALNASSKQETQHSMDHFFSACDVFGLIISIKKTEVMYQPVPHKAYSEPTITVKGEKLKAIDTFTYLGSTLSRSVRIDNEVDGRIAKASTGFGRLRKKVWVRTGLSQKTKVKVYKAIVLPSLYSKS